MPEFDYDCGSFGDFEDGFVDVDAAVESMARNGHDTPIYGLLDDVE